jgi:tetratricopeptide (TPR) repeat protein
MLLAAIISAGFLFQPPADPAAEWRANYDAGRQAFARQDFTEAVARLNAASELAAANQINDSALVDTLRFLAAVHRASGDPAQAEQVLLRAADPLSASETNALKLAAVLEEISSLQRIQGHPDQALETIGKAIAIRSALPDSPRIDLARALTAAAVLRSQAGDAEKTVESYQRAIREWDLAAPGDAQALPAIETLAVFYRERSQYAEAEPLFLRALRLREAMGGPAGAEVIVSVDSLAYVEFGLRKLPETEVLYRRLAALWEKNAGPDHPMLALTYDKMAEFYAFQQRYEDAEKYAKEALAIRTRLHIASLNQTGRVLLMEAKLPEAESLYRATIQIGDLAQAPDDALDPVLRIYAKILRELKRDDEAAALDVRVKNAVYRKADREGLRTPPGQHPAQ